MRLHLDVAGAFFLSLLLMRYFSELSYKGTSYHGWQRQPNGVSVQETIENALTTILGETIGVVGCGRTDAGVHASQYFLHFDFEKPFPKSFIDRLNKFLPKDISIKQISRLTMMRMHGTMLYQEAMSTI